MAKLSWLVLASVVTLAFSDLYMSLPRGSNNRLNEQNANRNNGDRLYDSQNNARGGYNVGDRIKSAFNGNAPSRDVDSTYDATDRTSTGQYPMVYFERSILPVEWANQHGCGGNGPNDPNKLNCQLILQYMCDTPRDATGSIAYGRDYALGVYLSDGGNTATPDEPQTATDVSAGTTFDRNNNNQRGRHESEGWYYECKTRPRNNRLFTADQNVGSRAINTRQNPNGGRRGLECPEERDYYPYWVPNPWRDVAYLTDRMDMADWIKSESMNTHNKYKCKQNNGLYNDNRVIEATTQFDCETRTNGLGVWTAFTHGMSSPANDVDVRPMPFTRDNHLGNGKDGVFVGYNWTLPDFDELVATGNVGTFGENFNYIRCVFRLRYNLTTDDYDPWNTTFTSNDRPSQGIKSPVTQNPTVDVGAQDLQGLALAINTNQFGRTFQDRSHVFYIKKRPPAWDANQIWNLNVRGKRGNIVQTYPAVEYDFSPIILNLDPNDSPLIHMQWTGSNTHNNGDPAGDGQAGDAGEGTGGTDRHSWVQTGNSDDNYPLPLDLYTAESMLLAGHSTCYDLNGADLDTRAATTTQGVNCALTLATSGQFLHYNEAVAGASTFNPLLNDAPASLIGGVVIDVHQLGTYNYIDTRNNNFSNRAQKGAITLQVGAQNGAQNNY